MAGTTTHRPTWTAEELAGFLRLVHSALREATGALLGTPAEAPAARARAATQIIGSLRHTMEEDAGAFTPATSAPGPELGPALLGAHTGTEIEGLAGVTVQLVELAWLRRERTPLPARMLTPLGQMAAAALQLVQAAAAALESPDRPEPVTRPGLLTHQQHLLYEELLAADEPVGSSDVADAVLISCALLRAGHHAESVVAQAALLSGSPAAR
jgi:hypothetical protein